MFESWPEMWGGGYPAYRTTLRKFLWFRTVTGGNAPEFKTVTGKIVDFITKRIAPLKIEADLEPIQSGTGDPSPDNVRPITGHTGADIYDDPVHGGTIEWNQLVVNGNFANGTDNWNVTNQLSMSASNNKLTATAVSKSTYAYVYQNNIPSIPSGHTVLITFYVTLSQAEKIAIGNGTGIITTSGTLTANERTRISAISTISSQLLAKLFIYTGRTAGLDIGSTCIIEDVQIHDLTKIYGVGNEPSTIEEFKALFPKDYYAYNAGEETCVSAVNGDPYTKVTLTFGSTVYGGKLTVNEDGTGTVVATHKAEACRSSQSGWTRSTSYPGGFYRTASYFGFKNHSEFKCSHAKYVTSTSQYLYGTCLSDNSINIRIMPSDSSLDDWYDYIEGQYTNGTPVMVYCELLTPVTIQLSDVQVNALLGNNTVWVEDSNSISVTYQSN